MVGHKPPFKKLLSPYRCKEIKYGSKVQQAPEEYSSPTLDKKLILRVQRIVGSLLHYATAVNNKLLVDLGVIGAHQASATEKMNLIWEYIQKHSGRTFRLSMKSYNTGRIC